MATASELTVARRSYFQHLVGADLEGARRQVAELLHRHQPERIILDVLAPTQALVGRRWEASQMSVADEHAATAVTDAALAQVGAAIPAPGDGPTVVLACVEGDWHSLPARMATELLRARGLPVRFLGASLPAADLATYLQQLHPAALCLTCSVASHLPGALRSIEAAHLSGTPVMAGGRGFGPDSHVAGRLGADAWARSTERAVRRLKTWTTSGPPPHLGVASADVAASTHLEIDRAEIITRTLQLVAENVPQSGALAAADPTSLDLGSVVEYLGLTLLTDDDRILGTHVGWLRRVLGGRGFPTSAIAATIEALTGALAERRLLTERTERALRGALDGARSVAPSEAEPAGTTPMSLRRGPRAGSGGCGERGSA